MSANNDDVTLPDNVAISTEIDIHNQEMNHQVGHILKYFWLKKFLSLLFKIEVNWTIDLKWWIFYWYIRKRKSFILS